MSEPVCAPAGRMVTKKAVAKQLSKQSRVKERFIVHLPYVNDGAILHCSIQSAPVGFAEQVIDQRLRLPNPYSHGGVERPQLAAGGDFVPMSALAPIQPLSWLRRGTGFDKSGHQAL